MKLMLTDPEMGVAKSLAMYVAYRSSEQVSVMGLVEAGDDLWALIYDGLEYSLVSGRDALKIKTKAATKLLLAAIRKEGL